MRFPGATRLAGRVSRECLSWDELTKHYPNMEYSSGNCRQSLRWLGMSQFRSVAAGCGGWAACGGSLDLEAPSAPWEGFSHHQAGRVLVCGCRPVLGCVFGGALCVVGTRLSASDAGACWAVVSRRRADSGGHGHDPGEWNPRRVLTDTTSPNAASGRACRGCGCGAVTLSWGLARASSVASLMVNVGVGLAGWLGLTG